MDEAVWASAKEYTGFYKLKSEGGELAEAQTFTKILPMEDRVYIGMKCMEPDIQQVIDTHSTRDMWEADRVELFISPSGGTYDYYQFVVSFGGRMVSNYYAEGGQITPDPYAPDWKSAVYVGEDHWSVEVELPLKAFYMTRNANMSDKWLINTIRCRTVKNVYHSIASSFCGLERGYTEFDRFLVAEGMPLRKDADDICIVSAEVDIREKDETGYAGCMTVKTFNGVDGAFTFSSDCAETMEVALKAGANQFTVPCHFTELKRHRISLALTRAEDGEVFKRYYPVTTTYEPIKLRFTQPEYRCNFYPGQDYSKITGSVIAAKPATLKLEGAGIDTQVKTPDADGSFVFETPNFEIGEAWLTVTIDGEEKKQRIRRLAPTDRMMTWVSGGNLVVDGKPVFARYMFAPTYRGGVVFSEKHRADNYYETRDIVQQSGWTQAEVILSRELGRSDAEVKKDVMPSEDVLRYLDARIEANKNKDFGFYYLFDEPECRGISPVYAKHIYEYIADRDPYHVTVIASRAPGRYIEAADWFQTHPYINPENLPDGRRVYSRPMKNLGSFIDEVTKQNRPDKTIGFIASAFSYKFVSRYADYPTLDETICHIWAAMIHGGKSLIPYAFHDMADRPAIREGMRYMFSSFAALEDIVLLGKRTTLLRTNDAEAVLYDHADEKMFVLVNFNQTPQTVTLEGISGTWHEFRHNRTITGNTFELKPLEVIIATNVVKDADLPTYAETAALIDGQEYERTHGGSLLFERENDITVKSAGVSASKYKLFDGVRDDMAMSVSNQGQRFIEVNLTKVNACFQKIVISGWNLQDKVALKLRIEGQLLTPAFTKVQEDALTTSFALQDAVCPEAIYLEFSGDEAMEMYELEVF